MLSIFREVEGGGLKGIIDESLFFLSSTWTCDSDPVLKATSLTKRGEA